MKNLRSHRFRHLAGLILILIGLMIWNVLPICSSNQAAQAAVRSNRMQLADGTPSKAVANGKIAFVKIDPDGSRNGRSAIYTMNPDGSEVRRLTSGPRDGQPAWSPDGTHIAFTTFTEDIFGYFGNGSIFVMNADGSNQAAAHPLRS